MPLRRVTTVAALFFVVNAVFLRAGPLTDIERQRLVAHLETTRSWLEDELSGLSTAQLGFRRAPDAWTILEVFDHLVVVGPIYWKDLQNARPAADGRTSWMSDADVLWYGIDRTRRETALTTEQPTRALRDLGTGLDEYRKQHAQLLRYIRTTSDDLRSRFVERQRCDAYQWALLISTHEQRHVLQIREIKADPKYPKK
jgi:DinB superfamily